MAWPLTWVVVAGTLPGVFLGYYIRGLYLPDLKAFKLFVGCVLLYIGIRLVKDLLGKAKAKTAGTKSLEERFKGRADEIKKTHSARAAAGIPADAVVKTISVSMKKIGHEFWGE